MRYIVIRDETLRDGLQQPGINLSNEARIETAFLSSQLLATKNSPLNNQIDLGMPEISRVAFQAITDSATYLNEQKIDCFVTGRATKEAIDVMVDSLSHLSSDKKIIAPFLGISEKHRMKCGLSKADVLKKVKEVITYAQKYISRIHFPLEGGYYAYIEDKQFVEDVFSLLTDLKVECVPLCDTVGNALPFTHDNSLSYKDTIKELCLKFPKVSIATHCHNDLGLAEANTIAGLLGGASIADGTYYGIGERAGNTSLQTLITILSEKREQLGMQCFSNLKKVHVISEKIRKILKIKISDNYPVVGKNVFSHASGIHQDGVLKDESLYQPYKPSEVGRRKHKIVLSALSGRKGIDYILRNKYNILLTPEELHEVTTLFKESLHRENLNDTLRQIVSKSLAKRENKR